MSPGLADLAFPLAVAAIAAVVARLVARRRTDAPTTATALGVPAQIDRDDFPRPDAAWLVVVFTSAACGTCAEVIAKARVLESRQVAVTEVEHGADRATHLRYGITAVPLLLVVDSDGTVVTHFAGPVTAQDLWAAVARGRDGAADPESDRGI